MIIDSNMKTVRAIVLKKNTIINARILIFVVNISKAL